MKYKTAWFLPIAAIAIGVAPVSFGAETADSEKVSKLLSDVRVRAAMLSTDATMLEGYTRSGAGWETHSTTVNRIREHINEAGRQLTELQNAQEEASPWQRTAIERIHPLLKELAANTETVIQYISENPRRLFMEDYKSYVEANADLSNELAAMISDFVKYGDTKQRLETLTEKLELEHVTER